MWHFCAGTWANYVTALCSTSTWYFAEGTSGIPKLSVLASAKMLISFAASKLAERAAPLEKREGEEPQAGSQRSPADSGSPAKCTSLLVHFCCDLFSPGKGRTANNCVLAWFCLFVCLFSTKKDDVGRSLTIGWRIWL